MTKKTSVFMIHVLLAIAVIIAFWRVNYHDFINLDDDIYVTENDHVRDGITVEGIKWAFTTMVASNWHPLTWISHMLDVQLFGLNPHWHHLINLLFHIANTCLLFFVFHRMTKALWQSAFVAAVFALHPLHVESVAWVAERKDVLSAFFWFLTTGAYISYVERPGHQRYLLVLIFFILGLMAKPMLVTLPFVLLLIDYWPLLRFQQKNPGQKIGIEIGKHLATDKQKRKFKKKNDVNEKVNTAQSVESPYQWTMIAPLLWEKIPLFALTVLSCMITYIAQQSGGAVVSMQAYPLGIRITNAFTSYVMYIVKMIWPSNLAVFYPHPESWALWQFLGAILFLIGLTWRVIRMARRCPYLLTGWFWYLGTLVPVIGFVQVGSQARADRYTYIPLTGLFIMTAWGIPELVKKWPYRKEALYISSALCLSCLLISTWTQVGYWENSISLFEHVLKVSDGSSNIHNNLGIALRSIGRINEAESHFREALNINPNNEQAHFNLGNLLRANGKTGEAIDHYTEALRIKPSYRKAHLNLGNAFMSQGRYQNAIAQYRAALAFGDVNAGIYSNIGVALSAMGQPEEAAAQFREAIRIHPDFAEAYNELGRILAIGGKTEEAISYFKKALKLKPDLAAARTNLKMAQSVYNKH